VLRQFVPTDISFFVELKYLTCWQGDQIRRILK
jgi:hypothetical protein